MARKIVTGVVLIILAVALTLALVACNGVKDSGKMFDSLVAASSNVTVNETVSLPSGSTSLSIDGYGVVKATYTSYSDTSYYFIPQGGEQVVSDNAFTTVGGGVYYTTARKAVDGVLDTVYIYYDATGRKIKESALSASLTYESGCYKLTFSDGEVYVVDSDGAATKDNPFSVEYGENGRADYFTENYKFSLDDSTAVIYEKNGNYVRSIDLERIFAVPVATYSTAIWTIEDYIYLQYTYMLPQTATIYDFITSGEKYNIITQRYDIKKDKVKKINHFDYLVLGETSIENLETGAAMKSNRYATLLVREIGTKKVLSGTVFVQTFKKDLYIHVNLQKLLSGAYSVAVSGDYLVLESDTMRAVFDGKDEVISYDITSGNITYDNKFLRVADTFYDISGRSVFTVTSDMTLLNTYSGRNVSDNGCLFYTVEGISGGSSTTLFSIHNLNNGALSQGKYISSISSRFYCYETETDAVAMVDVRTGEVVCMMDSYRSIVLQSSSGNYYLFALTDAGGNITYVRYSSFAKEIS